MVSVTRELFSFIYQLKTKMDRLYVLEDSVKSLFWKNSKPIRSCVLGSTSHRNLRALPSRSALGCASGTTLGQPAQVSMLGRTSDAASNINVVRGVPHMVVRADDILVSGLDDEEHLFNVNEVLSRLERAGL